MLEVSGIEDSNPQQRSSLLNQMKQTSHFTTPPSSSLPSVLLPHFIFPFTGRLRGPWERCKLSTWALQGGVPVRQRFWSILTLYSAEASATSNNTNNMVHWPLIGGLLHLVQREETGQGHSPPRPILAVPNVTAHPSTANVPTTVRQ